MTLRMRRKNQAVRPGESELQKVQSFGETRDRFRAVRRLRRRLPGCSDGGRHQVRAQAAELNVHNFYTALSVLYCLVGRYRIRGQQPYNYWLP
jgi:hypothetical protein